MSVYEGSWSAGKMNGNGVLTFRDGKIYTGEFLNDRRSGHGKMTSNIGTYEGQWRNDLYDGEGTFTGKDGEIKSGKWR